VLLELPPEHLLDELLATETTCQLATSCNSNSVREAIHA